MSRLSRVLLLALLGILLLPSSRAQQAHSPAFGQARDKLDWIARNGESATPSTRPTVLTAREWNAFLNEGGVKLPEGVTRVRLTSEPGIIHGEADIDFDRLTANRTRSNPLLFLFTGKHRVMADAHAQASHGIAKLNVDSVAFDGVQIPRFALEYFASHYLRPRFGNAVGMDSTFALHNRIDTAVVGADEVTITQR
jgi:hypothetical protein